MVRLRSYILYNSSTNSSTNCSNRSKELDDTVQGKYDAIHEDFRKKMENVSCEYDRWVVVGTGELYAVVDWIPAAM